MSDMALHARMAAVADNLDWYAGKTDGGTYAGGLQDAAGQIREALAGVQDGGADEAVRIADEQVSHFLVLADRMEVSAAGFGEAAGLASGSAVTQSLVAEAVRSSAAMVRSFTEQLRAALAATDGDR